MINNFTYIIVNTNEVTDDMVNQSMNKSDVARYSNDGNTAILKFNTKFPSTMAGYAKFTIEELTSYLEDNALDWDETI